MIFDNNNNNDNDNDNNNNNNNNNKNNNHNNNIYQLVFNDYIDYMYITQRKKEV